MSSSAEMITARLDSLIKEIRSIQGPNMHGEEHADIVLVAHGHILRAFTKRWLGYELSYPFAMMLEPGGVGILRYIRLPLLSLVRCEYTQDLLTRKQLPTS